MTTSTLPTDLMIEIGRYEAPPQNTIRTWLLDRPDLLKQIKEYLLAGGTLSAVRRWLATEKQFKGSHSRLDAVLYGTPDIEGILDIARPRER